MSDSLKQKTKKGVIWSTVERFSVQGVQFIVMIVMARLLTPHDYGIIGMLAIFLAIAQSLIDSGFSQALIRKTDRTETDNSTVFYFNLIVSGLLYLVLFLSAPLVAKFYHTLELCPVMRVVCLGIIFNSLAVVQRALLTVNIDFKTQAKASLSAAVMSGVIGITLAYHGAGVWALVVQQLVNLGVNTGLLWVLSSWRPKRVFSWQSFHELFAFGSKLLVSGLIYTIYQNLYTLVIGKLFAPSKLGHYTRAQQFSSFPSSNLTGVIQRVTYPVLCEIRNDEEHLKSVYRRFLKISAFIVFPLMVGLSAVSAPLVHVILGSKWDYCAQLLQILCFAMMWYPIHAINLNLLEVKGRSDLFLRLEIIKEILGVVILCATAPFGLLVMCYGQILNSILSLLINTCYTGKLIGLGFIKQMRDLLPTLILCLAMYILIAVINHFVTGNVARLLVDVIAGATFYLGISRILHFSELKSVFSLIKRK
jgi:O-antigen/teichoic acid export membrane protein